MASVKDKDLTPDHPTSVKDKDLTPDHPINCFPPAIGLGNGCSGDKPLSGNQQ